MKYELISFKVNGDSNGNLIALQKNQGIPFELKRVFYIFNTKNDIPRGRHANRKSQFVLIMLHGSCKVKIFEQDKETVFSLESPRQGLWLDKMVWKEMYDFSNDAVMLVLSNELYDKNEYITDYDSYMLEVFL